MFITTTMGNLNRMCMLCWGLLPWTRKGIWLGIPLIDEKEKEHIALLCGLR